MLFGRVRVRAGDGKIKEKGSDGVADPIQGYWEW
jgi:hypothetical protein